MISTLNENENGGKWRKRKKTNCRMNMNIESINEGNKTTFIVLNAIEKSTLFKHNVCIVFWNQTLTEPKMAIPQLTYIHSYMCLCTHNLCMKPLNFYKGILMFIILYHRFNENRLVPFEFLINFSLRSFFRPREPQILTNMEFQNGHAKNSMHIFSKRKIDHHVIWLNR